VCPISERVLCVRSWIKTGVRFRGRKSSPQSSEKVAVISSVVEGSAFGRPQTFPFLFPLFTLSRQEIKGAPILNAYFA
jgi:hypothetical protein